MSYLFVHSFPSFFRAQMVHLAQLVMLALKVNRADLGLWDHVDQEDQMYVN